jgi:hypothetical protein
MASEVSAVVRYSARVFNPGADSRIHLSVGDLQCQRDDRVRGPVDDRHGDVGGVRDVDGGVVRLTATPSG